MDVHRKKHRQKTENIESHLREILLNLTEST